MTTIKNFTPHPINVLTGLWEEGMDSAQNGEYVEIPSEGVARVDAQRGDHVSNVPMAGFQFIEIREADAMGEVYGLPEEENGVLLVVSIFVAQALKGLRSDLLVPATGPKDGCIRNDKGHIKAVKCLKRV